MHQDLFIVDQFPQPHAKAFTKHEWTKDYQNANVIIHSIEKDISFAKHWGPLSIKTCVIGNEYYIKDRGTYRVSNENYLILNENTEYGSYITNQEETESFTLNFSNLFHKQVLAALIHPEDIYDDFQHTNSVVFSEQLYPKSQKMDSLLNQIRYSIKSIRQNNLLLTELLFALLSELYIQNATIQTKINSIKACRIGTKTEIYKRLTIIKDYIDSCYFLEVDLKDLSRIALMSPYHLLRQFKSLYNVTPHQYLLQVRLEQAKKLLNHREPMLKVLKAVGFQDPSSFSKLYKKKFGYSPARRGYPFITE